MTLTDLQMSEEEKKQKDIKHTLIAEKPSYPHGLRIHIDGDTYAKLDMKDSPDVGEKMIIMAEVEVVGVNQDNYKDDEEKLSLELQIQKMKIKGSMEEKEEERDAAEAIYGKSEA